MTTTISEERDQMLHTIAQHAVDGNYSWNGHDDLKLLISNKLGHDVDNTEVKVIEKHIKELRAERRG